MATQTCATNIDGMLRLFRGDGNFADSTGNSADLVLHPGTGEADAGITFVSDTPYSNTSRLVFDFKEKGSARGSAKDLPGGAAPRTIIGWFKMISKSLTDVGYVFFSNFHDFLMLMKRI